MLFLIQVSMQRLRVKASEEIEVMPFKRNECIQARVGG